jgi:hypothetical protein
MGGQPQGSRSFGTELILAGWSLPSYAEAAAPGGLVELDGQETPCALRGP